MFEYTIISDGVNQRKILQHFPSKSSAVAYSKSNKPAEWLNVDLGKLTIQQVTSKVCY